MTSFNRGVSTPSKSSPLKLRGFLKYSVSAWLLAAGKVSPSLKKLFSSFLYSLVMDTYSMNHYSTAPFLDMPLNQKVFLAQYEAIQKIAGRESCVIVGRCADYALHNHEKCLNVFIHADKDVRIAEVCKRMDISVNKAKDMIQKQDKQRASYYNYYSNKKWGDSRNYHLTLDSSVLGIDGCVDMILACREKMLEKK